MPAAGPLPHLSSSLLASGQPWVDWHWVRHHLGVIRHDVWEHTFLTGLAVGIGLLIAVPLAILAYRQKWTEAPILGITGAIYTIPSLALLGFLVPITGLTTTTAEIALVGYTLLILVRNVLTGLREVPADIREAARGMGYTPTGQLLRVELPLAVPAIMAGLRVATVTTIGLVTITALIGAGGLGQLIYGGLNQDFRTLTVVGALASVALAVVADGVLVGVQRLVTPWTRRRSG
ncbi:MAG: osmoprotectant transport system permease protein [Acidimicrobiaceae bacterium]|nr:osmoprotectant transport system permease protein [Acidimicrobiaceae bacterium]